MANIDIEMSEFQKVTTLENKDYIVVSLDNGTQGQIKVSDLASVVAGCLGVNSTFVKLYSSKSYRLCRISDRQMFSFISCYAPYSDTSGHFSAITCSYQNNKLNYLCYGIFNYSFDVYYNKSDNYTDIFVSSPLYSGITLLITQGQEYLVAEEVSVIPSSAVKLEEGRHSV